MFSLKKIAFIEKHDSIEKLFSLRRPLPLKKYFMDKMLHLKKIGTS
jgi:hypothetical protein